MFGTGSAFAVAGTNPTDALDILGVGFDPADTAFHFFYNDAAGVATKTTIPGSFTIAANALHEVSVSCAPNSSIVTIKIRNCETGVEALIQPSTSIPANNKFLSPQIGLNTGAGSTANVLDFVLMYFEAGDPYTI
jgi:hypothetical protein